MQNSQNPYNLNLFLSNSFDHLFKDAEDRLLVDCLVRYIVTDDQPITTPDTWQDVAIYIRYQKRDVWSLTQEQHENAMRAILIYRIKYIINHLSKQDIIDILNKFYTQANQVNQDNQNQGNPNPTELDPESILSPTYFFEQKFHTPVDSLFLTQERITITKDNLKNLNQFFDYPCWLEFTDEANNIMFDRILKDELTDEQIDYFLGASDTIRHYDQWFQVVKHILTTTKNPHLFWIAGDILSIIWKAIPTDKSSQKWFNNQLFDIFWPRIGSLWPLQNEEKIDFNQSDDTRILRDSINWLQVISDLKTRLPELGQGYIIYDHDTDEADFNYTKHHLLNGIKEGTHTPEKTVNIFCALADYATTNQTIADLHKIAETKLLPYIKESINQSEFKQATTLINGAIKHAETYQKDLIREQSNLASYIKKH